MNSLFDRQYTKPINCWGQLSTTELIDYGSHSISKWILLIIWGEGAQIPQSAVYFSYTYIYSYEFYVRTSKLKIKYISRIIILSLNKRLPISFYAGNLCRASLLNYDTQHLYLSTYLLYLLSINISLIKCSTLMSSILICWAQKLKILIHH